MKNITPGGIASVNSKATYEDDVEALACLPNNFEEAVISICSSLHATLSTVQSEFK